MQDAPPTLVLFDMDGTLIDSAALISSAMAAAFAEADLAPPAPAAVRAIIGLSLPQAVARLAPAEAVPALTEGYRAAFVRLRAETGGEGAAPLFPGARACLDRLDAAGLLLGIATGKARRGLDHALRAHDIAARFVVTQSADDAPSKPDPGMVLNALRLTGVEAGRAALVGDSTFDMEMARAAGARAIGVAWGNRPPEALRAAGAETVLDDFDALDAALGALWAA